MQINTFKKSKIAGKENHLSVKILDGNARDVMQAADVLLLASGTAALEAMLYKKPMIVTYKVSKLSYFIIKRLATVTKVALPNHFDDSEPVPEYIQDEATLEKLGPALLKLLQNKAMQEKMCENFTNYHQLLKQNASEQAAKEVLNLL